MTIEMMKSGEPWLADYNHPHYLAGKKAIKAGEVFGDLFSSVAKSVLPAKRVTC